MRIVTYLLLAVATSIIASGCGRDSSLCVGAGSPCGDDVDCCGGGTLFCAGGTCQ